MEYTGTSVDENGIEYKWHIVPNKKENGQMKKSDSIKELAKALSDFQAKVKQPLKDKTNPHFKSKYVPLENVVEAITETANEFGLSFTQWAVSDENNRVGAATLLLHTSGEWIEYPPAYMKTDRDTAQGVGSAITYAKRYALSAIFGITSDQDDDGNAASGGGKEKVEPQDISIERLRDNYDELVKVQPQDKSFEEVYNELKERKFNHEQILVAIQKKKDMAEKAKKAGK